MAVKEKIRIRLQSYDAQLIDAAARRSWRPQSTHARVSGPSPSPSIGQIVPFYASLPQVRMTASSFERTPPSV